MISLEVVINVDEQEVGEVLGVKVPTVASNHHAIGKPNSWQMK